MLKLYAAKGTIAVASAFVLEEIGTPYDLHLIDFSSGEQTKPPFLGVNAKARVPALETPQGVLTETGAILEFLAPDWMPADLFKQAQVRSMIHYLASTMHVNHAHKLRGSRWSDDPAVIAAMKIKVPQTMSNSCAYVESQITGPFLFGDTLTIADAHLLPILGWLEGDGVDIANYPKLDALHKVLLARPSIVRLREKGAL